jgi:hypothetical protein
VARPLLYLAMMIRHLRRSTSLLLLGVILVPGGIGMWFWAMMLAFDGGGAWTGTMAVTGLLMIPGGLAAKLAIAVYEYSKGQPIPLWYWSDLGIIALLALLTAAITA